MMHYYPLRRTPFGLRIRSVRLESRTSFARRFAIAAAQFAGVLAAYIALLALGAYLEQ